MNERPIAGKFAAPGIPNRWRSSGPLVVLCSWLSLPAVLAAAPPGSDDPFTTEVRPILAQHCFKCHGPDEKTRKAGLRFDLREDLYREGRSGVSIIKPGKPDESELIRRISTTNPRTQMPPPSAKLPLSDRQKAILRQWVASGAEYRSHWAFLPPRLPPLPRVMQVDWPRNEIDRFILARLEAAGLRPSPEADRYALIRRLYLDLIGLPPAPEEADEFVLDSSPDAYEKQVERLLASPHYGERWARRWLDLARYADTNGYEKDRPRSIWPYRDWVIRALNADMPFDQFTIEQIAGDMVPRASLEQRVATGFHRNTMLNEEGGIDPLEFRFHALTDRLATTGTVWLGLTVGCAQCHSHKYDPLPQLEYYRMLAFLNNADEPMLDVPSAEVTARRTELAAQIAIREADLPRQFPPEDLRGPEDRRTEERRRKDHLERKFAEWMKREADRTVRWTLLRPSEAKANLPLLTVQEDGSIFASGDQTKSDIYTLKFRTGFRGLTALRLEALPDDRLPRHGPGRVYYEGPLGDFTLCEFRVFMGEKPVKLARASHSYANGKFTAEAAIDGHPQTGWSIDGGQGRAHSAVFNLAEPLDPLAGGRGREEGELTVNLLFERHYSAGLGRFRIAGTTDPRPAMARDLPPEIERLLLISAGDRPVRPGDEAQLDEYRRREILLRYFVRVAPELAKERAAIDQLRRQMLSPPTTLVFAERPHEHPRPTFLHRRGEFLQPSEPVIPGVPAVLHPFPEGARPDRLTFARWLVSSENPLVGRVTMNRQWAAFFGEGLVRTTQDFGLQGERPSHPELLDWLAIEFVRQGWSMKRMHRLIVRSAAYRQSARVTPELLARDPDNRLLARSARGRLEAELVRDSVLRASGLLATRLGGPSVFPPQPPGVTTEGAYGRLEWKVSEGPDRYRRGLYTFSKRTAPFAMFTTFDGPSGEACVARREVSNTPLQALTLLNDTVFIEASQALARQLASRPGSVEEKVTALFRRCLTRPPTAEERRLLVEFHQAQCRRFSMKELDPDSVAGAGPGDRIERAVWTIMARAILNLDETITRN